MGLLRKLRVNYRLLFNTFCKIDLMERHTKLLVDFEIEKYIRHLHEEPRYSDPKRLNKYGLRVYSQCGEDGIVAEIFRRVGAANKYFVEIGTGDGLENNTAYLLLQGWKGYWVDANRAFTDKIGVNFNHQIRSGQLCLKNASVNMKNVENLFADAKVPQEFDLLSIDIDGNDYWVWKAIEKYNPRVVVIEYNATYPPGISWVMKYNPKYSNNVSSYFGASLYSLVSLGNKKGYQLIGCTSSGVNAFFVREDLVKDRFCEPYTDSNHYEPPRYFLINRNTGHARAFGEYESV
ncbi:MAG: hypothetical protein JW994_06305 [Candidatus Omnitrophica bacterium]|nr:hypothetical protein [Candidatus Omnitrophota bacterium]